MFALDLDHEELRIRRLLENWAVWRDSGDWERLRTIWHEGGTMQATWFFGTGDDFVKASQGAWERGVEVLHTLHGISIDIRGNRAVAHQRANVDGVLCDCVCTGRFYDLIEKRNGRWAIVKRQPIYEKDHLDAVNPSEELSLDQDKLAALPAGYRHLAYLQQKIGLNVKLDLPGTKGPAVEGLYAEGKHWLAGATA